MLRRSATQLQQVPLQVNGTATPARTGDPQIHNLVL